MVHCECGASSERLEDLHTISLDFEPLDSPSLGAARSLERKLQAFTAKKHSNDEDVWDCVKCSRRRPPMQQVSYTLESFHVAGPLKRLSLHRQGQQWSAQPHIKLLLLPVAIFLIDLYLCS